MCFLGGKMASFRYNLLYSLFKILRVNKMLDKQGDEFKNLLASYDQKQKIPLKIPYKALKDFEIEEKISAGSEKMKFYTVKKKEQNPGVAVLYLFGGGYILPPDSGDIILCSQIAQKCDAEVWFPLYPMAPSHTLKETVTSVCGLYREMLQKFDGKNIRFFGTSSGGGLALSVCMFIRHEKLNLPFPSRLVLQSPGLQVPPSDKQRDKMTSLSKVDVMIPPRFFDNIAPVLAKGEDSYLLSPLVFDLSGFPAIDIFYGTKEVMFAYLEDMVDSCKKYALPLNVHIGKGMMHCWGAMDFVPEAKAVRKEYFAALR